MSPPSTPPQALEGLTVVDLTSQIAGPYAAKVLADLGARVIKVERPGGDPARRLGPFLHDEPGPGRSATFQFLNTNKESIVIDLTRAAGREVLNKLVRQSDLVISSFAPAVAERLGATPTDLGSESGPPLVWLTNFGRSGPYRDYRLSETTLFAMGGEMWSHGTAAREPLKYGGTAALMQCGAMAAIAALGAIHARELHGIGQVVDVPLFDVQVNSVDRRSSSILAYRFSGRVQARAPGATIGVAGGIYPVADGFVEATASFGDYWQRFVEMIGDDRLRAPKWTEPATQANPAAKEEADGIIYPWMLSRTRQEIWARARDTRAMVAPLFTAKDLYEDPVFRERGMWTEIEHQTLGRLPMMGRPYILEKTPWRIRRAAPLLGEHTDAVLSGAGFDGPAIAALRNEGAVQ